MGVAWAWHAMCESVVTVSPAITGTSKSKLVTGLGPWVGLDTAGTPLLAVDELTCRVFCSGGFLDCVRANPLRSEPRGGDGGG
jgi:hypothetical protein